MRIGIIATEFPPKSGGMQAEAINFAACLAQRHDVVVCTRIGNGFSHPAFRVESMLHGNVGRDRAALREIGVDAWLAANAGYGALAGRLSAPMVVCCNGNDFLTPWVTPIPELIDRTERWPFIWRYGERLRQAWRRRVLGAGLSRAEAIFAISRNTRDLLVRRFGFGPDRVPVIHPGVEDRFFQPRANRSGGAMECLTVAQLDSQSRHKNVDGVLRAITRLTPKLNICYTVFGDGDDRARLETLARNLGIADCVRFTGRRDSAEILKAYARADVFVLPVKASGVDVEGFGIVYVQANAGGVPVLAAQAGGAVDAMRDGEIGILIDEAEPDDIAQGIRRFAAERDRFDSDTIVAFAKGLRWPTVGAQVEALILTATATAPAFRFPNLRWSR
jgi:phosphatidylinositol alpha-1,6-mannosyltransferase